MELMIELNSQRNWDTWAGEDYLGAFRTPLLSGARKLLERGVDPETPLSLRHKGQSFPAMTSTVGAAAKLQVEEGDYAPRFRPYKPGEKARARSALEA